MGKRVAYRRFLLRLTISQLAKNTGLSEGYIKEVEEGKEVPSFQSLKRIARALNITTMELIYGKRRASKLASLPSDFDKLLPKEKTEIGKRIGRIVKLLKGLI